MTSSWFHLKQLIVQERKTHDLMAREDLEKRRQALLGSYYEAVQQAQVTRAQLMAVDQTLENHREKARQAIVRQRTQETQNIDDVPLFTNERDLIDWINTIATDETQDTINIINEELVRINDHPPPPPPSTPRNQ